MSNMTNSCISDIKKKDLPFPPIRHIMNTPAFLALAVVHFGQSWGYITLMTEIPSYLSNVHHYSISSVSDTYNLLLVFYSYYSY